MKLDSLRVKLRFQSSKVRGTKRPNIEQQMEIIQYLNTCMEKYDAHIVDIDVCADLERPEEK
jgi:RecA/RadA recombinase